MKTKYFVIFYLLLFNLLFSNTDKEKEIDKKVEEYISRLKGSSIDNLIILVRDGKKDMKRAAIKKLGELRSKKAIDILIAVMTYTWDSQRFEKKYMTGKKKLVPALDEDVRAEAALAIGKMENPENIYVIGNTIMVDRSSMVKQHCLNGLGLIGNRECIEYIIKAIKFELSLNKNKLDNDVVMTAVKVLGDIGHKDGFFILIEVTQSDKLKFDTRKEALKSLEKIRWE